MRLLILTLISIIGKGPLVAGQGRPGNFQIVDPPRAHLRIETVGQTEGVGGEPPQAIESPPAGQVERQQAATAEEELLQQEISIRTSQRVAVGLDIAQGAIEITLGAVRIAASGATAEVIRREDAVAASRASASNRPLGREEGGGVLRPGEGGEPIRNDASYAEEAARRAVCAQVLRRTQTVAADDPYSTWNSAYVHRMKRSLTFPHFIDTNRTRSYPIHMPTPNPNSLDSDPSFFPVKTPTIDEAEQLLNLLERLLNTNNEVLRVLGMDLAPISSQSANPGAMILKQYRQRLKQQRETEKFYGDNGYLEEDSMNNLIEQGQKWKATLGRTSDVNGLSSELAHLHRARQRYGVV